MNWIYVRGKYPEGSMEAYQKEALGRAGDMEDTRKHLIYVYMEVLRGNKVRVFQTVFEEIITENFPK